MKAIFFHRSVGHQLLSVIRSGDRIDGLDLWDYDANYKQLTTTFDGTARPSALQISDGDTNPPGLERFLKSVREDSAASEELAGFSAIGFKSCYSAAAIKSDDQLEAYQRAIAGVIALCQELAPGAVVFLLTPPPRRPIMTSRSDVDRARRFVAWMNGLSKPPSVQVFDLFSVLSDGGVLKPEFRRLAPWDQHPNDDGVAVAAAEFRRFLTGLPGMSS